MNGPPPIRELIVVRCGACHHASLPGDGRCPRCGSTELHSLSVAPQGKVVASTELMSVATGWTSPHRLAIVEAPEEVRLLAIVDGELPSVGSVVRITMDHGLYRVAGGLSAAAEEEGGRGASNLP